MQVSTGRLIIPMYAGLPSGASTCYSDECAFAVVLFCLIVFTVTCSDGCFAAMCSHGKTWHYSTKLLGGVLATEGEITELFSPEQSSTAAMPTLYYTIRNDQPHLPRQYATSTDLGCVRAQSYSRCTVAGCLMCEHDGSVATCRSTWSNLSALTDVRDPDCKGGVTRWG